MIQYDKIGRYHFSDYNRSLIIEKKEIKKKRLKKLKRKDFIIQTITVP